MGMIDLPMVGKLYTWFNGDGRSMSRIDHFIVTKKLIQLWGITSQWVGVRDDHWIPCMEEPANPKGDNVQACCPSRST